MKATEADLGPNSINPDQKKLMVELVEKQFIHPRVAQSNANNPEELKMRLKGIKTSDSF